jgi:hypothetical protein
VSQSDDVALRICDQREAPGACCPRFLHDPAAELFGPLDDCIDLIHPNEEHDKVVASLEWTDGRLQPIGHTGIDQGAAREGALAGLRPAEQVAEERAGHLPVVRAYLRVQNGVPRGNSRCYSVAGGMVPGTH